MKAGITTLLFVLICSNVVFAKPHSFNFNDIAKGTGAVKLVTRNVKVSKKVLGSNGRSAKTVSSVVVQKSFVPAPPPPPGSTNGKQFLVIAQAKVGANTHPSVPYVIVDSQPSVPGCKGLDYLFFSHCKASAPKTDFKPNLFELSRLSHSYIYIFEVPVGYKNVRIGFPAFGSCGLKRLGTTVVTTKDQCMSAPFRRRERYRPCITRNVRKYICSRPKCGRHCYIKWFKKKCRDKCCNAWVKEPCKYTYRYRDCTFSHFAIRILSATSSKHLRVIPKGHKYGSFTFCSHAQAARLFLVG